MLNTHIHAVASMQCRGIGTLASYLHSFRNSLHTWTLWLLTIFTFQAEEHLLTSIIKLDRAQYFITDVNAVCLHAELSDDRSVGTDTVMFTVCVGREGVNFVYIWISYWAKDNPNIELNLSLQPGFCGVSTVALRPCTFLSQSTATIAKSLCSAAKPWLHPPRFDFQMKLCTVWYPVAHGESVKRRF